VTDERRQNDSGASNQEELVGLWPIAVLAVGFAINMAGCFSESWDLHAYWRLACLWFALGFGLLVWQIVVRTFRWSVVLSALVLAALAFFSNLDVLTKMSASV